MATWLSCSFGFLKKNLAQRTQGNAGEEKNLTRGRQCAASCSKRIFFRPRRFRKAFDVRRSYLFRSEPLSNGGCLQWLTKGFDVGLRSLASGKFSLIE
jgi:hypothetical protein